MTTSEFSRQFDVRFNNVASNLAHGVTEYEKSLYLTQAQLEIIKNYFNPKGNKYQEGFDMSPKRDVDFSSITKFKRITTSSLYNASFGIKSVQLTINDDVLMILNDRFNYNLSVVSGLYAYNTNVVPITYTQYQSVLAKPYKNPPSRQTWRIIHTGGNTTGYIGIELIPKSIFDNALGFEYLVRYIQRPTPIITSTLTGGYTIQGLTAITQCLLVPEIHDEILNRAVELCRADYLGDIQTQVELNKRSE